MAIAMSMRRTNHWPTIARLITDNALWPRPRVSVTAMASAQNDCTPLITTTTAPSARATVVRTTRVPRRSMNRPMPIAKTDPINVAHKFSCAYSTRPMPSSDSSGSVTRPRPCVRPGRVPTMAAAASNSTVHP